MKYLLKKDLPFAKVGDVICLESENYEYKRIFLPRNLGKIIKNPFCIIHNDEIDEWLGEVKPREWNLILDFSGNFVDLYPADRFSDQPSSHQIIKVREVL